MRYEVILEHKHPFDQRKTKGWFEVGRLKVHNKAFAEYFSSALSGQVGYRTWVHELPDILDDQVHVESMEDVR